MNTYRARFWAKCPANGQAIDYSITIKTGQMIRVEQILDELSKVTEGFHEQIADALHAKLGGEQLITAHHHGVDIETRRPTLPHWIKPSELAA